jgi:hypothetical protein
MALEIPNTERKLREALYFLKCLYEKADATVPDPEEILHLLSAFLSAGRSVTFVLQAEAKEAYDSWFFGWWDSLSIDEQRLLDMMNKQRVSELHRRGADVRAELRFVPITEIRTGDRRHPAYGFHWFEPLEPMGTHTQMIGHVEHFFELGDGPEPVADSCRRYYTLLERLVYEFKKASHLAKRKIRLRAKLWMAYLAWFIGGFLHLLLVLYISKWFIITFLFLFLVIAFYVISLKCPYCKKPILNNPIHIFELEIWLTTPWMPKKCSKCGHDLK